jgi:ABC-type microcin C transport system duplicated ATPase subunit YejF
MEAGPTRLLGASAVPSVPFVGWRRASGFLAIAAYLVLTFLVAQSSLGVQSLVLVAAVFGIHLARILTRLKASGVTMIIIEHQTRFLFPLCDQITVLNAGEVILTGTADEVRANPTVRQVYLGE